MSYNHLGEGNMSFEKIHVAITKNIDNWYVATCDDLPGMFVANTELNKVLHDIPKVIGGFYKMVYRRNVEVRELKSPRPDVYPHEVKSVHVPQDWVVINKEAA